MIRMVTLLLLTPSLVAVSTPGAMGLSVEDPQCESRQDPLGIDALPPHLSWKLASTRRGERQTAYQVLVASGIDLLDRHEGDLWDSGKVHSEDSIQIAYAGKPLDSGRRYVWKVRVWDAEDKPSEWSPPACWTMGLLQPQDWTAKWIRADLQAKEDGAARMPIFRRSFALVQPPARAVISLCGLGQFELHVNGQRVGDDVLQPGWTNYRKTCLYVTYDVTDRLKQGENALGVMLGNGMYHVDPVRYTKFTGSFGPCKLIAQLLVEYPDGGSEPIVTDGSWQVAGGPITFSSIYGGEDYDARLEQPGWDQPGFDASTWSPALETTGPGGRLAGSTRSAPPIRVAQVLEPTKVSSPREGVWVYDLGQNCALMPRLTVSGPAGATVRMTPGEVLDRDGTVSQRHSGGPAYCAFTLKGGGDETWSPRFFYYGSRYIQVEGAVPSGAPEHPDLPVVRDLAGQFITSSAPTVGAFACSNRLFDRTNELIRWAMRSNMMSVLTDCPHREKLGWLEQDHLVGPSLMYNFEASSLFRKVCGDMADAQTDEGLVPNIAPEYHIFKGDFRDSPEWGSACVLIPWQLYQWYGDVSVLRDYYPMMKRYVAYLGTKAEDHVVTHGLGDWYDLGPRGPGPAQLTPKLLTATAFYYRDLIVLEHVARLLGYDDAEQHARLALAVRNAFNRRLYHRDTHSYTTGSQTANALPFVVGLVPPGEEASVLENIVQDVRQHDNGLTSGDIGYRFLLRALADGGRSDVIFAMNSRSDRPGYGYMIARGATSLTEAWDARKSSSQNHFMLGHIMEWFYSDLAGIQGAPGAVAFKEIRIQPRPVGDLTRAQASYDSVRGTITSRWRLEDATFLLDVGIPANTTATVYLPAQDAALVTESGRPLDQAEGVTVLPGNGSVVACRVLSGSFHFEVARQSSAGAGRNR